jgi:glycyl-tRNA synthetase beta chain
MRWGDHEFNFIRPVHWVLLLYGKNTITTDLFGLKSSNQTYGHRFHHPEQITITDPATYAETLRSSGYVIASFGERKTKITKDIKALCTDNEKVTINEDLLNEVTSLVEWPVVMQGNFNADYLEIPPEVLITSMQTHQKCFAVTDQRENLIPKFIIVSNIQSKDQKIVIQGNERVIDARLSDAAFFFHQDIKKPLEAYLPQLQHVVYQEKLGNLHDKVERMSILSGFIAKQLNADLPYAERAALLSKCDLLTGMVGEFPNLQGIMGYYYAKHAGEEPAIARGIKQHYFPRFAGDKLPSTIIGSIVGLADRIDTLVGIIGINELPTGDKDPFGLRRAAHGILRLLIEERLPLNLPDLLKQAIDNYDDYILTNKEVFEQTMDFITERLRYWYLENDTPSAVFEAVLAKNPKEPLDFHGRINAVIAFQKLPEANALAAANKRVSNILKKENISLNKASVDPNLFECEEEKNLTTALNKQQDIFDNYYQQANYTQALQSLAPLKQPIDNFFDKVMVMTDDSNVRNNRLAILVSLHSIFSKVADISLL